MYKCASNWNPQTTMFHTVLSLTVLAVSAGTIPWQSPDVASFSYFFGAQLRVTAEILDFLGCGHSRNSWNASD